MHLHYHKNGDLDNPPYFPPKDGSSGDSQPTAANHPPNASAPIIGRREYGMACAALVKHCWGTASTPNVGAVDITDIKNIKACEKVDETVILQS